MSTASSNTSARERTSFAEHDHVVVTGNVALHERLLQRLVNTHYFPHDVGQGMTNLVDHVRHRTLNFVTINSPFAIAHLGARQ